MCQSSLLKTQPAARAGGRWIVGLLDSKSRVFSFDAKGAPMIFTCQSGRLEPGPVLAVRGKERPKMIEESLLCSEVVDFNQPGTGAVVHSGEQCRVKAW